MSEALCPRCGKHDSIFVGRRYHLTCRQCENGGTQVPLRPPGSVPPFSRPVDNRP